MAYQAKLNLSGHWIRNFQCKLGYGKATLSTLIWIGGLEAQTSLTQLEEGFASFGDIIKIGFTMGDKEATIQFHTVEEAKSAVEKMRGSELNGKRLRTDFFTLQLRRSSTLLEHKKARRFTKTPSPTTTHAPTKSKAPTSLTVTTLKAGMQNVQLSPSTLSQPKASTPNISDLMQNTKVTSLASREMNMDRNETAAKAAPILNQHKADKQTKIPKALPAKAAVKATTTATQQGPANASTARVTKVSTLSTARRVAANI